MGQQTEMFGFFGSKHQKGRKWQPANTVARCTVFYREPLKGPGVYVEIRGEGDHLVYVSNRGVTPSFLNTPYDQWCREELLESYVFATLDSALDYFQRRKGDMPELVSSIRNSVAV